jgi:hypothetical protein
VDVITDRFLKYGAEFDKAIMRAGYSELSAPAVVATMEYIAWQKINKYLVTMTHGKKIAH